jgi:integrase
MRAFITDDVVRQLVPPARGNTIIWDDDAPGMPDSKVVGFGARITAKGAKAFVLDYRVKDTGDQRRPTIGKYPAMKAVRAREIARKWREQIEEGRDPQAERKAKREAPIVDELIARFDAEHIAECRPTTQIAYRLILRLHVAPAIGRLRVDDVEFDHVDAIRRRLTQAGKAIQANRAMSVISKMFTLAQRWKMRSDDKPNPARNISRQREIARDRYLSFPELTRLTAALAEHPDREGADVIMLLLWTGARKSEVMGMRWRDLDLDLKGANGGQATWNRRAADLKGRRNHTLPLSKDARALLLTIHAEQTKGRLGLPEFVFSSAASKTKHIISIRRLWRNVAKSADLPGVRIHDLRHSFASTLVSAGTSLPMIGSLLDHKNAATTMRYSHVNLDPQRVAVEVVAAAVAAAAQAGPPPETVRLKRRGG